MGHKTDAKAAVTALQLNSAGLFALLGGDEDDRLAFWGIRKGITTPAQWRVILDAVGDANRLLENAQEAVQQVRVVNAA